MATAIDLEATLPGGAHTAPLLGLPARFEALLRTHDRGRFASLLRGELEREKAARGADGRHLPWGDHLESTYASVGEGQEGVAATEPVDGHPTDESVYAIRGLAGNVRDWCANIWRHSGPRIERGRLILETAADDDDYRVIKGGSWNASAEQGRFGAQPALHRLTLGLRPVRSLS